VSPSRPAHRATLALAGVAFATAILLVGFIPAAACAVGTWKPQRLETDGTLVEFGSVTFTDRSHGWIAGDSGGIVATSDGGAHWTAHDAEGGHYSGALAFPDHAHGWTVNGGSIFATSDGGATWNPQTSGVDDDFNAITFIDSNRGWAVGSAWKQGGLGIIVATTDGGATWLPQTTARGDYELHSVAFTDADHGWAVGGNLITATTDGGANWTSQASGIHTALWSVTFTSVTHGWAVGLNGTIIATTDGGATWTTQTSGTEASLYSVAFTDSNHGWAVGIDTDSYGNPTAPVILATSDGGATWKAQDVSDFGATARLYSVSFVDATHGWAAGEIPSVSGESTPVILATDKQAPPVSGGK